MQYNYINVNSVLKKITTKDKLFFGNYSIDPYQNCELACLYCDSSFDKTIYIKSNAADVFRKELYKQNNGIVIVGSVHDPYQPIEKKEKITRSLLETIAESNFSCHILTKSDLVLRDLDLISKINNCIVTISVSSNKKTIKNIFEKNICSFERRINTINKLVNSNINSGLAIIPVLPFITENELNKIFKTAKEHNANYVIYKHLELKGDQKNIFFDILKSNFPNLLSKYKQIYKNSYMPNKEYLNEINTYFSNLYNKYLIKKSIF